MNSLVAVLAGCFVRFGAVFEVLARFGGVAELMLLLFGSVWRVFYAILGVVD
ncbi:MAG: hypothetical protein Q4C71_04810 [Microbacteriaceae bacterium]|nr:hypothetical protein [Microbacteriaceae bacterium]